jgi:hypothetical protein
MAPDTQAVRDTLLNNPKYMQLSGRYNELSSFLAVIKETGGGGGLVIAELLSRAKATANAAMETVSATYAVYKLTQVIPKEANKRTAVEALKKQLAAKAFVMGPSLLLECDRLATVT